MKRYLRLILPYAVKDENMIDIDLDVIKEVHMQFVSQKNRENFNIVREDQRSIKNLTESLFKYQEYVINWVNRFLTWQLIEKNISYLQSVERDNWQTIEKKIIVK